MDRVSAAIQSGRCVIAVGGDLLKDASVRLAIAERQGMGFIDLSGAAPAPLVPVRADAVTRAVAQPGGMLVIVEPQPADQAGVQQLGALVSRGPHKPTVLVVSRSFNLLAWMGIFPGMQVVAEKAKAKAFFKKLAKPPAELPALPAEAKAQVAAAGKSDRKRGVRPVFVGREEELEALRGELAQPGPLVVGGVMGIGKSSLVEHAFHELDGVTRLPDLNLHWDVGFDALLTRLAVVLDTSGHGELLSALKTPAKPHDRVAQVVEHLQAASGAAGKAMVIRDLDVTLGQDDHFRHSDRLALLLKALLIHTYPLTLVFLTTRQPVFYLEGQATGLRRFQVEGIKGRFYHEVFEAYQAPEIARDKFGPLSERLMGHPMSVRAMAVAVRTRDDGEKLVDDGKFLKRNSLGDDKSLRKRLEKQIEKLPKPQRAALARAAHFLYAVDGSLLSKAGVKRDERIALVAAGLLEQQGPDSARVYRVHRMVRSVMSRRETSDFKLYAALATEYRRLADKAADKVQKLAYQQETNRMLVAGRLGRSVLPLPGPDADALVDSVIGILRANNPRVDIARARLREVLGVDPHNSTARLLACEVVRAEGGDGNAMNNVFELAIAEAPIAEVYHALASYRLEKKGGRKKAVHALQMGIEAFPDDARMRRRLAGLHLRAGEFEEAEKVLREAMEKEPMMPDSYGLLGSTLALIGPERWDDAEPFIREALRLAPEDPVHAARLASLLIDRARAGMGNVEALRAEARELVDEALKADRVPLDVYLTKATLLLDLRGDIEQTAFLVGKAKKIATRDPNRRARVDRVRTRLLVWQGKLEEADKLARELLKRGRPDHRVVALLAEVLEARGLLVPAHAEYQRAITMTSSEWYKRVYNNQLNRLQGLIEAAAHAAATAAEAADAPIVAPVDAQAVLDGTPQKVVRRSADGTHTEVGAAHSVPADVDAALTPPEDFVAVSADADTVKLEAPVAAADSAAVPEAVEAPAVEVAVAAPVEAEVVEAAPVETEVVEAPPEAPQDDSGPTLVAPAPELPERSEEA